MNICPCSYGTPHCVRCYVHIHGVIPNWRDFTLLRINGQFLFNWHSENMNIFTWYSSLRSSLCSNVQMNGELGKRWDKPSQTNSWGINYNYGIGKKDMNITFRKAKRTIWKYEHILPLPEAPPSAAKQPNHRPLSGQPLRPPSGQNPPALKGPNMNRGNHIFICPYTKPPLLMKIKYVKKS